MRRIASVAIAIVIVLTTPAVVNAAPPGEFEITSSWTGGGYGMSLVDATGGAVWTRALDTSGAFAFVRLRLSDGTPLSRTPVGNYSAKGVDIDRVTHRLVYATDSDVSPGTLHLLEPDGVERRPSLRLPNSAGIVTVDESRGRIYIASGGTSAGISIVDEASWQVVGSFWLPYGLQIEGMTVNSTNNALYVGTTFGQPLLMVLDEMTGALRKVTYPEGPINGLAYDEIANRVWARYSISNQATAYDGTDLAPVSHYTGEGRISSIAVAGQTGLVYAAESDGNYAGFTAVLDGATGRRERTIPTDGAISVDVNPATGQAYIGTVGGAIDVVSGPRPDAAGSSVVYRFWSPEFHTHFFTISADESTHIRSTYPASTWTYEGAAYKAFSSWRPGTVPLYRFWSSQFRGHFFTTSLSERDVVIAGYAADVWRYEGIAYYVIPVGLTVLDSLGVDRFWSATDRHHFYTASAAESAYVKANYRPEQWSFEGTAFRVF